MPSKADGTFFAQQDVLLTPGYWEVVMRNPMLSSVSREIAESAYGLFIQNFLSDNSGYLACSSCRSMLERASEQIRGYGLSSYFAQSSRTGSDPVLVVAATVWEKKCGRWPCCVHNDIKRKRDASLTATPTPTPIAAPVPKPAAQPYGLLS